MQILFEFSPGPWQMFTVVRITLSKVSFSDLLGRNDFLDHPDPFEQIFDFYNF